MRGWAMNWGTLDTNGQLALAALVVAIVALGFALAANFPGLKGALVVFRDAVLWLAMCVVIGSVALVIWHQAAKATVATHTTEVRPASTPAPSESREQVFRRHTIASQKTP